MDDTPRRNGVVPALVPPDTHLSNTRNHMAKQSWECSSLCSPLNVASCTRTAGHH